MVAPQCKVELKGSEKKTSFHRIRNLIGRIQKKHESVKYQHETDNLIGDEVVNPMF
jgi:hypothetical protein